MAYKIGLGCLWQLRFSVHTLTHDHVSTAQERPVQWSVNAVTTEGLTFLDDGGRKTR